jgi:hypothetical protein
MEKSNSRLSDKNECERGRMILVNDKKRDFMCVRNEKRNNNENGVK